MFALLIRAVHALTHREEYQAGLRVGLGDEPNFQPVRGAA